MPDTVVDALQGQAGPGPDDLEPVEILRPARQTLPVVLASPHSGRIYPAAFVAQSRLDAFELRRSEDCFVDELFTPSIGLGIPLLRAHFPRAFVDVNREPFELDPAMFDGPLPTYANTASPRLAAGLGTIARIVAQGQEIYGEPLSFGEVLGRIDRCYRPYHRALRSLIRQTRNRFGYCLVIDCHSMPSPERRLATPGARQSACPVRFVIGDNHGTSCSHAVTRAAIEGVERLGYSAALNVPYAGGFTTANYGAPKEGVHTIQIEIDRSLYVDETTMEKLPEFGRLAAGLRDYVAGISESLTGRGR